ncbi:Golgi apyrase [Terramyces sp. JEL0728]|nr:Golgi apyrase [Terramyces sp. JEL0728]
MYPLRRTNSSQFKRKKSIIPIIYEDNGKPTSNFVYALIALAAVVFISIWYLSSSNFDITPDTYTENSMFALNMPTIKDISNVNTDKRYCVVIDAGSSGSRVYVYTWDSPSSASKSVIGIAKPSGGAFEKKIKPGISSLAHDPSRVSSYIEPLLEFAAASVPYELHPITPIYLYATAGLRLVEETAREALLSKACLFTLQNYKFGIESCNTNFRMISGETEGILGWIAVNYLDHKFTKETVGFMDMGGASTQIAFEPHKNNNQKDLFKVNVRLLDGSQSIHNVFVTSFLGYGVNQARIKYVKTLLDQIESDKLNTTDPCLPVGLQIRAKSNITGSGSFQKCYEAITPILGKEKACHKDPCPIDGVHVPLQDYGRGKFLGISEFWYTTAHGFGLGGIYQPEAMYSALAKHCSYSWSELETKFHAKEFENIDSLSKLQLQCFKGAYILNLLHEGLRFPRSSIDVDSNIELHTIDELSGFSVSWTFGLAFIYASSTIAKMKESYTWEYFYLFSLVLFLAYILFKYMQSRKLAVFDMSKYHAADQSTIHIEMP